MKGFDFLAYVWLAEYRNGTTLKQFEPSGKEHLFSEIDQSKLLKFGWIPTIPRFFPVSINLNKGQKLKAFRKNFISFISGQQTIVYVIGTEGQQLIWIFSDEIVIGNENLI